MIDQLDLKQLRAFVRVVETGSFSGAARSLGMSQSAVSQAVRPLEDSLRVRLRDRRERRRGHVTVACVPSVALRLMPPVLAAFQREHPFVTVALREISRHQ